MNSSGSIKSKPQRAYVPTTALATSIAFDDAMMRVTFRDGRILWVPLAWFPSLYAPTPEQRGRYEIGGATWGHIGRNWTRICRSPG